MPALEPILPHLAPFVLVLARLGGLFLFTPLLASPAIPIRARAMLAIILSLAVYPLIVHSGAAWPPNATVDLLTLGPLMLGEMAVGAIIGLLASIPIFAAQIGGTIMGQQLGVGLASVFNPAMETESDMVGELMLYLALATFIALGGLEAAFAALIATFTSLPVGTFAASDAPLDTLVALVASGFHLALRIAVPVLCILLLETIAAGIIMRTIPQINILTIGFAIKTVVGFLILAGAVYTIEDVIGQEIVRAASAVWRWAGG